MRIEQRVWSGGQWSGGEELSDPAQDPAPDPAQDPAQLVLLFGGTDVLASEPWRAPLRARHPEAQWFGCSTAGEIHDTRVHDDTVIATAIRFEDTPLRLRHTSLEQADGDSRRTGGTLARSLPADDLRHVLVLSDGQQVNGSELVRGMLAELPPGVQVTGGLAGDGARFERTLVLADGEPRSGVVAAIGLYGSALRVGFGSLGGWDTFGPKRIITRSQGNVLHALDGKPALELYKTYLGEHAAGLPSTGLLFPLSIRRPGEPRTVVRTILGVDEGEQSLTFAGDVPEGSVAQLMKANFERLIDGAADAAKASHEGLGGPGPAPELAVLISCVGRKLVLKQRTEEEVESVRDVLGPTTALTGFYSYGEICPAAPNADCELHNQTMTITTFREELGSQPS